MLKTIINTVHKSHRKVFILVAILFIVFSVFFNAPIVSANESDDVGAVTSSITGYDSEDGELVNRILNGGDSIGLRLTASGKSEAEAIAIVAPIHSKLYPLISEASKHYDAVENNGGQIETSGVGGSEVLKWANGVNFNGSATNLENYKKYLQAQNELFRELLFAYETHKFTWPADLNINHIMKVLGSNYNVLAAIESGQITKDTDGDPNGDGSGIEFDIEGAIDLDTSTDARNLPSDLVRFVDQSQNIPEEVRNSVKQASAIQCYRGGLEIDIVGCLAIGSYNILLKGSSLILALVGMVFNMSLNFTLNIGELFNNSSFGLGGSTGAIYVGWSTVRNFINVIFIFVLLYVAISTIIQNDKYGAKKMVTKIVIAALLINFSLFFSKAIIDLSNILALQFYARILESAKSVNGGAIGADTIDGGLSSAMLNAIGLESMWTAQGQQYSPGNNSAAQFGSSIGLDAYQLLALSIFGGAFILVFALVLFVAIAQFLMRTIVLLFLMITSPFGFIGEAIPALGGVASDWRKRLTNNAIFAPAYMAILFVICQIMFGGARGDVVGGGNFANLLIGTEEERVGSIGIFFWFLLMMGLLLTGQGAARGFADKFGKGFVDKAEDAFKGKGKYGWRKGAAWTGGKAWGGAKASAKWTGGKVSEGLRRTPGVSAISRILPKKTRDAWYQAGVDRAKDKADNLRQKRGEDNAVFEKRKHDMTRAAQERQIRAAGLDPATHFDHTSSEEVYAKDDNGNNVLIGHRLGNLSSAGKQKIADLKRENASRVNLVFGRRQRRADSIKRLEAAYGKPKAGSEGAVGAQIKAAKKKLDDIRADPTRGAVDTQLQSELSAAEADLAAGVHGSGEKVKKAKKALVDHREEEAKMEREISELEEKLDRVKEKAKEDKAKKK